MMLLWISHQKGKAIFMFIPFCILNLLLFFCEACENGKKIASDIKEELIERYDYLDNEVDKDEYLSKLNEIDEGYHDC